MTVATQTKEERDKQNALLKKYGYNWRREGSLWRLVNLRDQVVSVSQALENIQSGKAEEVKPRFSTASRAAAIQWAHSLVSRSQRSRPIVILDTETTGVDMTDIAVQIGIVDLRGNVLVNTLVYPGDTEISQGAFETHGLSNETLSNAPMFESIWVELRAILEEADLLIFNAPFDVRLLTQTTTKYGLTMPPLRTHCVMQQFSMFIGEVSSPPLKAETYVVQSLEKACAHFGIENTGAHDALGDAKATRDVLVAMAVLYEE